MSEEKSVFLFYIFTNYVILQHKNGITINIYNIIMRKLLISLLLAMPVVASAQDNVWEQYRPVAPETDARYLAGAVPVVDGKVTFTTTIAAPGKTADQVYDIMLSELKKLTQGEEQYKDKSRVTLDDRQNHQLVATCQEQLVFKRKPLNFDFTRLMYYLKVDCNDGEAVLTLTRIHYLYDEERDPQEYTAEDWITDRYGLTKKQDKLARVSGKFRRKTIDRKDYLFEQFTNALK